MGDQMLYHNEDIGMGLLNYAWFHASVDVLFVGIVLTDGTFKWSFSRMYFLMCSQV
jgi:hypothetical protein